MKPTKILLMLLCLLIIPFVMGAVTHSGVSPTNHTMTTSTSVDFKWNATSGVNATIKTYLYITETGNETSYVLNATNSSCVNNTQCGYTVAGFSEGYYQWYIKSTDNVDANNYTSGVRWLQIRSVANETYFNWKNDSGFLAMKLNKDTGELWTAGNISTVLNFLVDTTYFGWNGTYLSWVFGTIYTQALIELMNTTLNNRITAVNDTTYTILEIEAFNDTLYRVAQIELMNTTLINEDTALGNRITDLNDSYNRSTLIKDGDNYLSVNQTWLETLFYTITQIEVFNTSLYSIFYTQTEVEAINSSAVKTGENISSNYVTDTPPVCPANQAIVQFGTINNNFSESTCADNWLNIAGNEEVTGEVNFTGNVTSNAYYAEIWFHNDTGPGEVTVIGTQNLWYNLTGFNTSDTSGQKLNGFSWNNGTEDLTANVAGLYMVVFDVSAGNAGNNQEMQYSIQVNGAIQDNADAHRKIGTGGDVGHAGDTAFIDLAVGDIVELVVRNNDGTADLESFAGSVNIVRIAD